MNSIQNGKYCTVYNSTKLLKCNNLYKNYKKYSTYIKKDSYNKCINIKLSNKNVLYTSKRLFTIKNNLTYNKTTYSECIDSIIKHDNDTKLYLQELKTLLYDVPLHKRFTKNYKKEFLCTIKKLLNILNVNIFSKPEIDLLSTVIPFTSRYYNLTFRQRIGLLQLQVYEYNVYSPKNVLKYLENAFKIKDDKDNNSEKPKDTDDNETIISNDSGIKDIKGTSKKDTKDINRKDNKNDDKNTNKKNDKKANKTSIPKEFLNDIFKNPNDTIRDKKDNLNNKKSNKDDKPDTKHLTNILYLIMAISFFMTMSALFLGSLVDKICMTDDDFLEYIMPLSSIQDKNRIELVEKKNIEEVHYSLIFPDEISYNKYIKAVSDIKAAKQLPVAHALRDERLRQAKDVFNTVIEDILIKFHDISNNTYNTKKYLERMYSLPNVSILSGYYTTKHENFRKMIHEYYSTKINSNINSEKQSYLYTYKDNHIFDILSFVIPLLLIGALLAPAIRKSSTNIFNMGRTNFRVDPSQNKVRFADVAGLDEAKLEVMELVSFLQNFSKFRELGARIPRGAQLIGPPGTGKTLLAKAIAGESQVAFFSLSGSDFLEMFVGVGASRVRDLFSQARKAAPSIVFIDEIDAVGRSRTKRGSFGGNEERESTLNQILVEMDGFTPNHNVIVLAGTNRVDMLDQALLRPGRFDRQILVDKPDLRGRRDILLVHLKNIKLLRSANDIATRISALTPGMVGADLANVCNEAAILAARAKKNTVDLDDFQKAVDRVLAGFEQKNKVITQDERNIIAYHEAGHAIIGWFLEHADPLLKVTIVPRSGGSLGFAQYLPKELGLISQQGLYDRIAMALGGRASEQIHFNEISTGASDDIMRVSQIARSMVQAYGMSSKLLNFSSNGIGNEFTTGYSERTAQIIDEEVQDIVTKQYERAKKLLLEKKEYVKSLAEALLKYETLDHDDIVKILGPRPYLTDSYVKYVEHFRELQRELQQRKDTLDTDDTAMRVVDIQEQGDTKKQDEVGIDGAKKQDEVDIDGAKKQDEVDIDGAKKQDEVDIDGAMKAETNDVINTKSTSDENNNDRKDKNIEDEKSKGISK